MLSTILYMQNIAKLQNSQNPGELLSVLNQCIVPWCLHAGRAMPSLSCQSSNSGAHLKQKCEILLETTLQPCSIESTKLTKIVQETPALCTCLSCHVGEFYPMAKRKKLHYRTFLSATLSRRWRKVFSQTSLKRLSSGLLSACSWVAGRSYRWLAMITTSLVCTCVYIPAPAESKHLQIQYFWQPKYPIIKLQQGSSNFCSRSWDFFKSESSGETPRPFLMSSSIGRLAATIEESHLCKCVELLNCPSKRLLAHPASAGNSKCWQLFPVFNQKLSYTKFP